MREFRARSRSTRAIFFTQFSLLRLFLRRKMWESVQKQLKMCRQKYFLCKDLARAAELQVGSTVCRVHWDEIRRSNNRCSIPRENHSRGLRKQRIPATLFAVLVAIGATCHVMSKCPLELVLSISIFTIYSLRPEEMVLMHVHSFLYCWPNFIFS